MAISIQELQSMKDALERARARGAREVQMNGERVRYGSDEEMRTALRDLNRKINSQLGSGAPSRPRSLLPKTTTGWR